MGCARAYDRRRVVAGLAGLRRTRRNGSGEATLLPGARLASQAWSEAARRAHIKLRLGTHGESDARVVGTQLETDQSSWPREL